MTDFLDIAVDIRLISAVKPISTLAQARKSFKESNKTQSSHPQNPDTSIHSSIRTHAMSSDVQTLLQEKAEATTDGEFRDTTDTIEIDIDGHRLVFKKISYDYREDDIHVRVEYDGTIYTLEKHTGRYGFNSMVSLVMDEVM